MEFGLCYTANAYDRHVTDRLIFDVVFNAGNVEIETVLYVSTLNAFSVFVKH